jgi:hypothetical protein
MTGPTLFSLTIGIESPLDEEERCDRILASKTRSRLSRMIVWWYALDNEESDRLSPDPYN